MAELRRDIGLIGAAFIALNGIVGAGIFAMPQTLVEGAGAASPYLILLFGVAIIIVALVFGELAGMFESTGGPVVYADAAFGGFAGFQVGWMYYLARVASFAANTNLLLTYAATFAPGIDQGLFRLGVIAALVVVILIINTLGVKGAVRTLNLITVLKVTPLLALVIGGLVLFAGSIPAPQAPANPGAIGEISLVLLYAYMGFELVTITAGETRNPKQQVPRALVAVIAGATVFYFAIQLAYVAIMQGAAPEGAPLAAAAGVLAGPTGALVMAVAAIVSVGGNLFAGMIVTPRLTFAMAEEGVLPRWFGVTHARFATPINSILVAGLVAGALAVSGAFLWLAVMSALARLLIYFICAGALIKLRRDAPAVKCPLATQALRTVTPLLAAALCVWAAAQASLQAWAFVGGFAVFGGVLYALSRWRRRAASPI